MPKRPLDSSPPFDGFDVVYPFAGRWLVQNSPADRVPSHGTRRFATSYAIDFVPVDEAGRSAQMTARSLLRPEPPERFPGFGRVVTAPLAGRVIGVLDGEVDHPAFRGISSVLYAITQARRVASGWEALAGNHVLIAATSGAVVALCHLRRGSIRVSPGAPVDAGEPVAECGNSGNSTEPHLHLQAMDGVDPTFAHALPLTFGGRVPSNGTVVARV